MAKINNRKAVQAATHTPHMAGPSGGPTGMPPAGNMGPGSAAQQSMPKPNMSGGMGGSQLHHHHAHPDGSTQGGDEVGMFHQM